MRAVGVNLTHGAMADLRREASDLDDVTGMNGARERKLIGDQGARIRGGPTGAMLCRER
jgi:hypothetical protein